MESTAVRWLHWHVPLLSLLSHSHLHLVTLPLPLLSSSSIATPVADAAAVLRTLCCWLRQLLLLLESCVGAGAGAAAVAVSCTTCALALAPALVVTLALSLTPWLLL